MDAIHHKLQIEEPGQPPVQIQGASDPGQGLPSPGSIDPLLLAWYTLLEASNISDKSALVHAKQLSQNAQAEQKLNAEIAAVGRESVPILETKHHTTWILHYYFFFWWFSKKTWTTHPNQDAVDQAKAQNQELGVKRQMLSGKMSALQQESQGQTQHLYDITSEAMQTEQEAVGLLQILQNLTYQALLRHAPQG